MWTQFGKPFKERVTPFGSMTECHSISAKDHSRLHQCDKKVLPGTFVGYALIAVRLWKGDWKGDIFEIHARRLNAKEVLIRFPEYRPRYDQPERGEERKDDMCNWKAVTGAYRNLGRVSRSSQQEGCIWSGTGTQQR